ncbi:MAG: hypothetical protein QM632_04760 [Micrococcaceae bacterium]
MQRVSLGVIYQRSKVFNAFEIISKRKRLRKLELFCREKLIFFSDDDQVVALKILQWSYVLAEYSSLIGFYGLGLASVLLVQGDVLVLVAGTVPFGLVMLFLIGNKKQFQKFSTLKNLPQWGRHQKASALLDFLSKDYCVKYFLFFRLVPYVSGYLSAALMRGIDVTCVLLTSFVCIGSFYFAIFSSRVLSLGIPLCTVLKKEKCSRFTREITPLTITQEIPTGNIWKQQILSIIAQRLLVSSRRLTGQKAAIIVMPSLILIVFSFFAWKDLEFSYFCIGVCLVSSAVSMFTMNIWFLSSLQDIKLLESLHYYCSKGKLQLRLRKALLSTTLKYYSPLVGVSFLALMVLSLLNSKLDLGDLLFLELLCVESFIHNILILKLIILRSLGFLSIAHHRINHPATLDGMVSNVVEDYLFVGIPFISVSYSLAFFYKTSNIAPITVLYLCFLIATFLYVRNKEMRIV